MEGDPLKSGDLLDVNNFVFPVVSAVPAHAMGLADVVAAGATTHPGEVMPLEKLVPILVGIFPVQKLTILYAGVIMRAPFPLALF